MASNKAASAYAAKYRRNNRELLRQKQCAYRLKHREQYRVSDRRYRKSHKEALRVYGHGWYIENKERVRAYIIVNHGRNRIRDRAYYALHKEQKTLQKRAWTSRNPDKKRAADTRARAVRRQGKSAGRVTTEQWKAIVAAYKGRCAYCGVKPKKLTQDHVVPLARGGAHIPSNVVPSCSSCNCSKGAREPISLPPIRLLL